MTTPQKPEVDLMPPGVVNHELTKRMLDLFNNDFEIRNTLVQLVVSNKIQRTDDYHFFAAHKG